MKTEEQRWRELDAISLEDLKGLFEKYTDLSDAMTAVSLQNLKETIIAHEYPEDAQADD